MGNTVSCCARREAETASASSGSPKEPRLFLSTLAASSSKSSSPEAPSSPVDEVPMELPRQATNRVRGCGQVGSAHRGLSRHAAGL
jgi:hypothetical protein